jgi:hypothetical protein
MRLLRYSFAKASNEASFSLLQLSLSTGSHEGLTKEQIWMSSSFDSAKRYGASIAIVEIQHAAIVEF